MERGTRNQSALTSRQTKRPLAEGQEAVSSKLAAIGMGGFRSRQAASFKSVARRTVGPSIFFRRAERHNVVFVIPDRRLDFQRSGLGAIIE
jgi:hypothetical protein